MGKRSGFPHRDDELAAMSDGEIAAEIARCRSRLRFAGSAKQAKQWRKRVHWLETTIANRAGSNGEEMEEMGSRLPS